MLNLNKFHKSFCCFHCRLWTSNTAWVLAFTFHAKTLTLNEWTRFKKILVCIFMENYTSRNPFTENVLVIDKPGTYWTLFFQIFPFNPIEKIRKTFGFLIFQVDQNGTLRKNGDIREKEMKIYNRALLSFSFLRNKCSCELKSYLVNTLPFQIPQSGIVSKSHF